MACMILYNLKRPHDAHDLKTSPDLSSLLKCTGIYDKLIDVVTQNLYRSELDDDEFVESTIESIILTLTNTIYEILDDLKAMRTRVSRQSLVAIPNADN